MTRPRARAVLVALAVLLSGCTLVPGGASAPGNGPGGTVTPAPVPVGDGDGRVVGPTPDPTAAPCFAPRVADETVAPRSTPGTPVSLPVTNGTVDGTRLAAGHVAALESVSYRLATDRYEVRTVPNGTAFVYEARLPPITHHWYAIGGTLYVYVELASGTAYVKEGPYDPGRLDGRTFAALVREEATLLTPPNAAYSQPEGSHGSLTGHEWLDRWVAGTDLTVVGNATWRGTPVRELRTTRTAAPPDSGGPTASPSAGTATETTGSPATGATPGTETPATAETETYVPNVTVYVDARGIVRYAAVAGPGSTGPRETLRVTDVGTVRIERPPEFCDPNVQGAVPLVPPATTANDTGAASGTGTASDAANVTDTAPLPLSGLRPPRADRSAAVRKFMTFDRQ